MPLQVVQEIHDVEVRRPPWVTTSGVVSLLAMLEFAARDYVEMAYQFGAVLATLSKDQPQQLDVSRSIQSLLDESGRLGLPVTHAVLLDLLMEMAKANPAGVKITGEGVGKVVHVAHTVLDHQRMCHHIETIYSTLKAELKSISFRVIPSGKAKYCNKEWLFGSAIYDHFPRAWTEFQTAGRCYAYGENTACAFHLQRALEWGLKSLAVHLGKRFDRNSWGKHIEDIEKELKIRYGAAGPRSGEEKFYSEAATQFGNMRVAWRNPTMHVEAKYDETEAAYLLTTIERFIDHLAKNKLSEPTNEQA